MYSTYVNVTIDIVRLTDVYPAGIIFLFFCITSLSLPLLYTVFVCIVDVR